jgi:diguanylate cyclase (GGDEF)-like protein
MGIEFTPRERRALHGMLAGDASDIILKTDREGFILCATQAIGRLGLPLQSMLIGPHLLDIASPSHVHLLRAEQAAALCGSPSGRWVEFPARLEGERTHWFEIQLKSLADAQGSTYGTLGLLRSIEQRKRLEQRLFEIELTDALTGLTNRRAFLAMLEHLVERKGGGCLALFDIDRFQSINLQYGQSIGDKVLMVFADLLRTYMRQEDIVSRVGDECMGVLLPTGDPKRAKATCRRVLDTLGDIREGVGSRELSITASVGIARIGGSLDDTLRRAEIATFIAKAKGRNMLEVDWT